MKKVLVVLATVLCLCSFTLLASTVASSETTLKGTLTVKAAYNDLASGDDSNCGDWVTTNTKYTIYLVVCGEIDCSQCGVDYELAKMWLVYKEGKDSIITVFSTDPGEGEEPMDLTMVCLNSDTGIGAGMNLAFVDPVTQTPVLLSMIGNEKVIKNVVTITDLAGNISSSDVEPGAECGIGSHFLFGSASLKRFTVKLPVDTACPTCQPDQCGGTMDAVEALVNK